MSKSSPDSAIFMEDSEQEVNRKIGKSFCPLNKLEGNRTIEFIQFFAFVYAGKFHIQRAEKYGGDLFYDSFEKFCEDYEKGLIFPDDIKTSIAREINKILNPVRKHFAEDPFAKKIYDMVKIYQKENDELKKKEAKNQPKVEAKEE